MGGRIIRALELCVACIVLVVSACESSGDKPENDSSTDIGISQEVVDTSDGETPDGGVDVCQPECSDKVCGEDGCGGSCGDCGEGEKCVGGQCEVLPECEEGESCDDGDPCTDDDLCMELTCRGTPKVCDDDIECTDDSCADGECVFKVAADKCLINAVCYEKGDIHDKKPCRECIPSVSDCEFTNDDNNECDDDDACIVGDYCLDGECEAGDDDLDCDDNNFCTDDMCESKIGCVNKDNVLSCDDLDACTKDDVCGNGICGGAEVNCDDGNVCTADSCVSETGCLNENTTDACDDADACTDNDACAAGDCVGELKTCDDGNICTTDSCLPLEPGGCVYLDNDVACEDGNQCSLGDTCVSGDCVAGVGVMVCDDFNVCTEDSCEPVTGCKHKNVAALCDDLDPCTEGDFCANGTCQNGAAICQCDNDGDCAEFDDDNLCNGTWYCDKGEIPHTCKTDPGSVVACDDSQDTECLEYQCQSETGDCLASAVNEGGNCSDGDGCTLDDECVASQCLGTACEDEGLACVGGECKDAGCGNGVVDPGLGEDCDDANDDACDGCEECKKYSHLSFLPSNSYASTALMDPVTVSDSTVEAWVRMPDSFSNVIKPVVLAQHNSSTSSLGFTIIVFSDNGSRTFIAKVKAATGNCGSNCSQLGGNDQLVAGSWYHVALVRDGDALRLYVDGALRDSTTVPPNYWPAAKTFRIGLGEDPFWPRFTGSVDEVRLSSVVRYSGDFNPARRFAPDADTIALWHLDEASGTVALDASANSHTLTLNGNPAWTADDCFGTSPDAIVCGDGQQAPWEECDDGNTDDGDWCSGECEEEDMVPVPAGPFWMGCNAALDNECEADEYPAHEVTVEEFSVDITQVTVDHYAQCVNSGQCSDPSTPLTSCNWGKVGKELHPMNCISKLEAETFCAWAEKRLCSEAEWEKAARGGCELYDGVCADNMPKYPWGNASVSCDYATYYTGVAGCGTGGTLPVGSTPQGSGPYGNLDMVGNLWDWVDDCYHSTYQGAPADGSAWKTGCENGWSLRGGSFWSTSASIRSSSRHQGHIGVGGFDVHTAGLRCCRSL
jgi:formylglycine-generating enzyme required for sulfatase activity